MRFVLDNSVVMRWLLNDGSKERLAYASKVLDLLIQDTGDALVPGVWSLEVANVRVKAPYKRLGVRSACKRVCWLDGRNGRHRRHQHCRTSLGRYLATGKALQAVVLRCGLLGIGTA